MTQTGHPVQTCPATGRRFKIYKGGVKRYLCAHDKLRTQCREGKCIESYRYRKPCPCGSGKQIQDCDSCALNKKNKRRPIHTCTSTGRKFQINKVGKKIYLCEHGKHKTKCKIGDCFKRYRNVCNEKCPCGSSVNLQNCRKCNTPGAGLRYCPISKKSRAFCRCGDRKCGSRICEHDKRIHLCPTCSPILHLISVVRTRVNEVMAKGYKTKRTMEYLGCSSESFREHLEASFQPGMTWENRGEWEIGHRKPLREKGISFEETVRRLHFSNTFAQWKKDNRAQGNKFHFTEY